MCVNCIRSQVDITEGIQKQVTIMWCKACGRYLQPPKHWLKADLESKELLTYCIKRVKGLSKASDRSAGRRGRALRLAGPAAAGARRGGGRRAACLLPRPEPELPCATPASHPRPANLPP
jgi:hypothetical protein